MKLLNALFKIAVVLIGAVFALNLLALLITAPHIFVGVLLIGMLGYAAFFFIREAFRAWS